MIDLAVFLMAAAASYWYETEVVLFFAAIYLTVRFLIKWYSPVARAWPPDRGRMARWVIGLLPAAAFALILATLSTAASYDVVGIWVLFYLLLGSAWIRAGMFLMRRLLDLSWADDGIYADNKAAIVPVAGGFLGITLIYAGANTGDGPGWWVVFIAGGLGLIAWLGLACAINRAARVSERITVDRDFGCGIRFGAYLLASGLILARASGGDWTSFSATLIEFLIGWPVLPLALLAALIELFMGYQSGLREEPGGSGPIMLSALWGGAYVAFAVGFLLMVGL